MGQNPVRQLREYAASLVEEAGEVDSRRAVERSLRGAPSASPSWRRRLVTTGVAAMTFVTGNVGLALASDGAVPGDVLYPLDRAYERVADFVGVRNDRARERIQEAVELHRRGNVDRALAATREGIAWLDASLDAPGLTEALEELDAAGFGELLRDATLDDVLLGEARRLTALAGEVVEEAHRHNSGKLKEKSKALKDQITKVSEIAHQLKDKGKPDQNPAGNETGPKPSIAD